MFKKLLKVKNITSLSIWLFKSVDIKDIYSFNYLGLNLLQVVLFDID